MTNESMSLSNGSIVHVGGPLLTTRSDIDATVTASDSASASASTPPSCTTAGSVSPAQRCEPVVIGNDFVILPQPAGILQVRAYATGKRLGVLVIVPNGTDSDTPGDRDATNKSNDNDNHEDKNDKKDEQDKEGQDKGKVGSNSTVTSSSLHITCTALTPTSLLVGCNDGVLYCFDIAKTKEALRKASTATAETFWTSSYQVVGPAVTPHSSLNLSTQSQSQSHANKRQQSLRFLTSVGNWIYALQQVACNRNQGKIPGFCVQLQLVAVNLLDQDRQVQTLDTLTMFTGKPRKERTDDKSRVVNLHARAMPSSPQEHLLILTRMAEFHVYRIQTDNKAINAAATVANQTTWNPMHSKGTNFVACTALGSHTMAIGMESGEIRLYPRFTTALVEVLHAPKGGGATKHPLIRHRVLHWHAHAVTTLHLPYDENNDLDETMFSGGQEAVLCQWDTGSSAALQQHQRAKPSLVLPRLASQALTYVGLTKHGHVLVAAADETLQLITAHNQVRKWRIQAWPAHGHLTNQQAHRVRLLTRSKPDGSIALMATGLEAVAGQLVEYDARQQYVRHALTVVPYNAVSRTESSQKQWPSPMVTQAVMAKQTLATVHTVPTELGGNDNDNPYISPGVLKFWCLDTKSNTYKPVAMVTEPHGPNSCITAMALSPSGRFSCTVSCEGDDKSFRLWQVVTVQEDKGEDENTDGVSPKESSTESTTWIGRYRVGLPAGYINQKVGAVTFSSDDSVLAIAFSNTISFWDVRRGAFITAINHFGDHPVKALNFFTHGPFIDTLVSFSDSAIALQSPFGAGGPSNVGWTWELPNVRASLLTQMLVLERDIVVALYDKVATHTVCLILDIQQGHVRHELILLQKSRVVALAKAEGNNGDTTAVSFYAMTHDGNLFRLSTLSKFSRTQNISDSFPADMQTDVGQAPIVAPLANVPLRERKRTALVLTPDLPEAKRRPTSLMMEEDDADMDRLPRLKNSVTQWFLSRHLQRS